jgi:hypothetical protein
VAGPFLPAALAVGSGGIVGIVLGLIGGGSILAVPLLVHVVGVASPQVAIGTAAVAVAINAAMSLAHARQGTVNCPWATVFAASGMAGAALGAEASKALDGRKLLALFGLAARGLPRSQLAGAYLTEQP